MLVKPQANPIARIKVVGVGGGGGNVLNTMVDDGGIIDVEYVAINTDSQALQQSKAHKKLRIGEQITRGLGSGGNPVIGRKAAEESVDDIHENLAGADMVFVTAGMGGGTGTGASPIVGEISKNLGALTIAVVMKPFHFEGKPRMEKALKGIEDLKDNVDTMVVIPNQKLLEIMDPGESFLNAMHKADEVLLQAVKSIANLSSQTGLINVDFADVRSVMDNAGTALMGLGAASGENRAEEAARMAIESPLLEIEIDGATGVLFNVVGGMNMGIQEIDKAAQIVRERISEDANFIFGATIDPDIQDDTVNVTVIATGFPEDDSQRIMSDVQRRPVRMPRQMPSSRPAAAKAEPVKIEEVEDEDLDAAPQVRGNVFGQSDSGRTELDDIPAFQRRKMKDKADD